MKNRSLLQLLLCLWLSAASTGGAPILAGENISLRQEVQHAISQGAAWLERNQDAKGFWSTAEHPAVTALALVALRGVTGTNSAVESPALKKGYEYVLSCAQPDGGIYRKPELVTYNTAVSMLALLAVNRPEDRPVILRARQYLVGLQTDFDEPGKVDNVFDGGVGYGSHYPHSDMSNTMQALEALYYSKQLAKDQTLAGARDLNWEAAIHFIQSCQNLPEYNKEQWVSGDPQNKGGFVYYPGYSMAGETNLPSGRVALRSYGSISYAGLLSYIYAELKPDDPRVSAVLTWLQTNFTLEENPGMGPQGRFYYFHTMAKALNLVGLDTVELKDGRKVNWREALALKLVQLQQKDGSWANVNNRWWEKDPALVTSYALISLEMVNRKL
jgi:squalene-hopene/tetraprenyl-beta-curcumene cyclase